MAKSSRKISVAIADDHSLLRNALAKLINTFEGYTIVIEADNGKDLRNKIMQQGIPDIVMLDINMPEMDGFEFMDALRCRGDAKRIPVIVITAKDLTEEDHRRLNGGVERIIQKGATSQGEVLELVRALLIGKVDYEV